MSEATIFATALDKSDAAERSAYLDEACAGDEALRRRVDELLLAHAQAGDFLEKPAVEQMTVDERFDFLEPSERSDSLGRFAGYEVLEIVCRSPLGAVVLKAFDDKLHRVVAIKLLASESASHGAAGRRFLREARAAAAVRDDHVVAVHGVFEAPVPYLVMEYVAGQSLQQKLDQTGPLELHQILRIGSQAACGLAAIHAQGLVHRDIKPANILLENGIERVKITDFGLARAVDDATASQPGTVAGTPTYMSPEQAQGEPIDQRSDLFSLGSVLYALCTGRPPFRAADTLAVLRRVIDDTPRPVAAINPQIPGWLSDLIARLHAKRAADRPQSAAEVADLLARRLAALQGPGGASISPAPVRQRAPARSRRWAAAAVLVLAFAGLGAAEVSGLSHLTGTAIRVFNPDGTLVIETDDADVSVTIDGKELVIHGAGPREIRLRPGQHLIKPAQEGVRVDAPLIVIERNGRSVVRVRREAPSAIAPMAAAKESPAAPMAAPGAVSAVELARTFRANAALGAAKYADRRIAVTGRLLRVADGQRVWSTIHDWGRNYRLELDSGEGAEGCYLSFQFFVKDGIDSPLAKLNVDEIVTIEGECKGWSTQQNPQDQRPCICFWDGKVLVPEKTATRQTTAERGAAQPFQGLVPWILSVDGSVRIKQDGVGESWLFSGKGKVPETSFTVTAVGLSGCKNVHDADLAKLASLSELTQLRLEYLPITDTGLAHVAQLRGLSAIYLGRSSVGDGAISLLAKLQDLNAVDLSETKITEAGLKHLDELSKVTTLALRDLPVTDATMPHLAELTYLTDLNLSGTKITDVGLRQLAKLDRLQILSLSKTALTDSSLETLGRLKLLFRLNLEGTQIKGTGFAHFGKLDKLQELSLADTPLTDAALEQVAKLTSLRHLYLRNNDATPSGIAKLRRALPQCQVIVD